MKKDTSMIANITDIKLLKDGKGLYIEIVLGDHSFISSGNSHEDTKGMYESLKKQWENYKAKHNTELTQ